MINKYELSLDEKEQEKIDNAFEDITDSMKNNELGMNHTAIINNRNKRRNTFIESSLFSFK
jgi:S-adenosylmethionine:tRNA-ribosyltransferase-isomerase (queuine synthetase)